MSLCTGCLRGGGLPTCQIKICASGKGVTNCSQCAQLTECKNFEWLEEGYPKVKEDLMKIKNTDRREHMEKWMDELKTKWPYCVLFCPSAEEQTS